SVTGSRGITPPVGHQTHVLRDTDRFASQIRHSLCTLDMPPLGVAAGDVLAADRFPASVALRVGDLCGMHRRLLRKGRSGGGIAHRRRGVLSTGDAQKIATSRLVLGKGRYPSMGGLGYARGHRPSVAMVTP